jgi:cytochrome c biogenesis protein CcdA
MSRGLAFAIVIPVVVGYWAIVMGPQLMRSRELRRETLLVAGVAAGALVSVFGALVIGALIAEAMDLEAGARWVARGIAFGILFLGWQLVTRIRSTNKSDADQSPTLDRPG